MLIAACVLLSGGLATRPAAAQTACSEDPTLCEGPRVTLTPASMTWSGSEPVAELAVTVEWCDSFGFDPDSRVVRLDGVPVQTTWVSAARTAGCFVRAVSRVSLSLGAGEHTLTAEIQDADGMTGAASAVYGYTYTPPPPATTPPTTPPSYAVAVTPDGASARRGAAEPAAEVFAVRNAGTGAARFRLQPVCTGAGVSGCAAQMDSLTLPAGASASVAVTYQPASAGATGTVWLKAWKSDAAAVRDSGSVAVTVAAAPTAGNVQEAGDNTRLDRGDCVSAGAWSGAYECGDLRLAHALPPTRVLNTAREPVLLYNSQHARPHPVVAAHFAPPAGTAPAEISATLRLAVGASTRTASRSWPGWAAGQTRRIAVGLDAAGVGTGAYDYTLEITARYADGTTRVFPRTGRLVVVDRSASPFGAGWWVAGVEQLFHPADGSKLWVGGDGSTRLYRPAGIANRWVADAYDRPDTLKWVDSAGVYVRALPGGVEVRFDGDGRHVQTRNRAGHVSAFTWSGALLSRIHLPRAPGFDTGYAYVLAYAGSPARLVSVSSPASPRMLRVGMDAAGRVAQLTDLSGSPDSTFVRFAYADGTGRVARRTDRMGVAVDFAYDAAYRLARAAHTMGTATSSDDRVLAFTAAEGLGTTPVVATAVRTLLDGPRTDVADTTRIAVDRYGAPVQVRDALGHATQLSRNDPAWPALVTRVLYPNRRMVLATYDARGNVSSVADTEADSLTGAARGPGSVTSYAWDARWDAVARVTGPEGETSTFGYDELGRRAWEQAGDDDRRRVFYRYYPMESSNAPGLPRAVRTPLRTDTLVYDERGNLRSTYKTLLHADALGRDTLTQVDGVRTYLRYDAAGRVKEERVLGGADTVVVTHQYDAEDRVLRTGRRMSRDPNRIGTLWQSWRYDAAGRVVMAARDSGGGYADSTYHHPSGAYTEVFTTRGSGPLRNVVRTETDALGRLVRRTSTSSAYREEGFAVPGREFRFPRMALGPAGGIAVPGDTATFTYDAVGNLLTAHNRDARITRAYTAGGRLESETQSLRSAAGTSFGAHVFTTTYRYDRSGRLVRVRYPHPLAYEAKKDSIVYQYAPGTGDLARVLDLEGHAFVFGYDAAGQVEWLEKPGGIREAYGYYEDGSLEAIERVAENAYAGTAGGLDYLRREWIDRIWGGKIAGVQTTRRASRSTGNTLQAGGMASTYDGFGALRTFRFESPPHLLKEAREVESDPLGNAVRQRLTRRVVDEWSDGDEPNATRTTTDTMVYQPGRGQLAWRGTRHPDGYAGMYGQPLYVAEHRWWFDPAGNMMAEDGWRYLGKEEVGDGSYFYNFNLREYARSYYDAEDRLRFYDRQRCVVRSYSSGSASSCDPWTNWPHHESGVWQEYRYDALGRRVMAAASYEAPCENGCRSFTDFVVWSGDQMIGELRGGFGSDTYGAGNWEGRIAYTHGPGIDAPLSLVRHGIGAAAVTIVPHANWRGTYGAGTYASGSTAGALDLTTVRWPADDLGAYLAPTEPYAEDQPWMGGLIGNIQDANGWLYRRNRYYDPQTGRFTQEDPIGIAGGLNLYAFGGGDAVSYTDPYGLSCEPQPECDKDKSKGSGGLLVAATTVAIAEPTPAGETILGIAVIGAAAAAGIDALGDGIRRSRERTYVTYTLTNAAGRVYVGRASGYGTPHQVMMQRYSSHERRLQGFGTPELDRSAVGLGGRSAIRGREQQLIDSLGGVGSLGIANQIRAVSKINPVGRLYHGAANTAFGEIAPYTGY